MNVPRFTANTSCKSLQPSPNSSPLICDYTYLLTNRRCLSNDYSSRQYPLLSSRRSPLFRNRKRRHIALPLYLCSKSAMSYPICYPYCFPFLSRCLFCFAFCFALTWISKRSDLCYYFVGLLLGFDEWEEVYVLGTAGFRNDTRRQVNCSDGCGGGWCLSPFPCFRGR